MPSATLKLNVGDGLGFDQDGNICVKYAGENIRVVNEGTAGQLGLYVDDLTGVNGSVSDNWSTIPGRGINRTNPYTTTNNFVDINRDVSNMIFTYGLYIAGNRNDTTITYTSTVKSVENIRLEMNFPIDQNGQNKTSFRPITGELIQLVDGPTFRTVYDRNGGRIATEDGTRSGNNNQTTKVLFIIKDIRYLSEDVPPGSDYWVKAMTLTCLYSSVPEYVVGTEYATSQQ